MSERSPANVSRIKLTDLTLGQLIELVTESRQQGKYLILNIQGIPQEQMNGFMARVMEIIPGAKIESSGIIEEAKKD